MFKRYKRGIMLAKIVAPLDGNQFGLKTEKKTKHFTIVTYTIDCVDFETRKMTVFYPNTFRAAVHAENLVGGGIAMKRINSRNYIINAGVKKFVQDNHWALMDIELALFILAGIPSIVCCVVYGVTLLRDKSYKPWRNRTYGGVLGMLVALIVGNIHDYILWADDSMNIKIPNAFKNFL